MLQLDLFEGDKDVLIMQKVDKLEKSLDNVRRGVFVRVNELEKLVLEMQRNAKEAAAQ